MHAAIEFGLDGRFYMTLHLATRCVFYIFRCFSDICPELNFNIAALTPGVLLLYPFASALYNFVIHKRVQLSEQQSLWTLRKLLRKIDMVWFPCRYVWV